MWVEFDNNIKTSYVNLLNKAFEYNLKHVIEDDFECMSDSIKIILEKKLERSFDELSLELNLWKATRRECNLPMPTCRYLKPHIISKWNLMKPPSDTMTKIIDSMCTALPVNGSQGPAISRLFKHCAYDAMKMYQACTSKKNIDDFCSAQAWRNSASHRMQHPKCVEKLASHYLTNNFAENLGLITPSRGSSAGRTRIGLMTEPKNIYSSTFTGGAPERKRLEFYYQDEDACDIVAKKTMKRKNDCMGVPAFPLDLKESDIRPGSDLFSKKIRRSCAVCGRRTSMHCVCCHTFLCMGSHDKNEQVEAKTLSVVTNGNKKFFYNTCWLQFHEAALDKHFENQKK